MTYIGWRFPLRSGGPRQGYTDNNIEAFKGQELIDNLTREICQNSLDAHREDINAPVKVVFELKYVQKANFDVFSQYERSLKGCRAYWGGNMDAKLEKFICHAESTLKRETIPLLVVSDYNTKGLSGCCSDEISSSWEALTGSDGISVKSDEASAGSFGIGKNAPFACSSLSMVFYNTIAEDSSSAFIGVARLATHLDEDGKERQCFGKYQQVVDDEQERWNPIYPKTENKFRDCFLRKEPGTDVIIVGFSEVPNWLDNVTNAVLKNFFVAICEKKLVVELRDNEQHTIIDADSIEQLFSELENDPKRAKKCKMVPTCQFYKTFTLSEKKTFKVFEPDDVEVYVRIDADYKRQVARFRATGMLVGIDRKQYIYKHYAAVVIVRGKRLGKLLKDTEPPRHDKWDYKRVEEERRKEAKEAIGKINDFLNHSLNSEVDDIPEKTVDAIGVGEYLPDDVDENGNKLKGNNIPNLSVRIVKVKTKKTTQGTINHVAIQSKGTEQRGEVHNHTRNPNPTKSSKSVPVNPNPDDPKPRQGITQGNGSKTLTTPNLDQRAFPIDVSQGYYQIVIIPKEDYNNLFIKCFAVGENGHQDSDSLEIESFTYNGESIKITDGQAGPIIVKKGNPAKFFVKFQRKEKMMLSVHLFEAVKK